MNDIFSIIYNTLVELGYPVREQGTYAPDETLPETHVTYQLIDSPNDSSADNLPTSTTYRVQVNLYSRDPAITQGADDALRSILLPVGFMRVSGRSLPYDIKTGHYGFTSDYRYYMYF